MCSEASKQHRKGVELTLVLNGKVQARRRRGPAVDCRRADLLRLAAAAFASCTVDVAFAVACSRGQGLAIAGVDVARLLLRAGGLHKVSQPK